ncbi:hypothetical protein FQN55_008160 [Onygenales sp. PD_40]|nr:hypothetical protein FQN55_008160 [Onygenales sp. PD_40]
MKWSSEALSAFPIKLGLGVRHYYDILTYGLLDRGFDAPDLRSIEFKLRRPDNIIIQDVVESTLSGEMPFNLSGHQ